MFKLLLQGLVPFVTYALTVYNVAQYALVMNANPGLCVSSVCARVWVCISISHHVTLAMKVILEVIGW